MQTVAQETAQPSTQQAFHDHVARSVGTAPLQGT